MRLVRCQIFVVDKHMLKLGASVMLASVVYVTLAAREHLAFPYLLGDVG